MFANVSLSCCKQKNLLTLSLNEELFHLQKKEEQEASDPTVPWNPHMTGDMTEIRYGFIIWNEAFVGVEHACSGRILQRVTSKQLQSSVCHFVTSVMTNRCDVITPVGPTGLLSELSIITFHFPSRIHTGFVGFLWKHVTNIPDIQKWGQESGNYLCGNKFIMLILYILLLLFQCCFVNKKIFVRLSQICFISEHSIHCFQKSVRKGQHLPKSILSKLLSVYLLHTIENVSWIHLSFFLILLIGNLPLLTLRLSWRW